MKNGEKKPVVIVSHGFKGFKDWGSMEYLCNEIARQNYFVVSFNFTHNGILGNSQEFTELKKFKANTFSKEIKELDFIINSFVSCIGTEFIGEYDNNFKRDFNPNKIYLLGHSRGGGISILAASKNESVKKVAVWGSVSTFERYSARQKETWRKTGVFKTKNMRTGQIMELGLELLNDLEKNSSKLDILSAANKLDNLLIVHGEQDLVVSLQEAQNLYSAGKKGSTYLKIIENTGHTFGAAHPFNGANKYLDLAIKFTTDFFNN